MENFLNVNSVSFIKAWCLKLITLEAAGERGSVLQVNPGRKVLISVLGLCFLAQMLNIPEPRASSMTSLQSATTLVPFSRASGRI